MEKLTHNKSMPSCPFAQGCLQCFVGLYLMEFAAWNRDNLPTKEVKRQMLGISRVQIAHYTTVHNKIWSNIPHRGLIEIKNQ